MMRIIIMVMRMRMMGITIMMRKMRMRMMRMRLRMMRMRLNELLQILGHAGDTEDPGVRQQMKSRFIQPSNVIFLRI